MDFFRVLPGYPSEAIDGVFIHTGQSRGLPNAVLLEEAIQNPHGLIQRKPTA
jgi:hypothetical protein